MVAAGTAAHCDHAREIVFLLHKLAIGEAPDYEIRDQAKLKRLSEEYGIETRDRDSKELAEELAEILLNEFGQQKGEMVLKNRAPEKTKEMWRREGLIPRGIDREIVEDMHRTHIGVDKDFRDIIRQSMRVALTDGWAGSMISTDLSDII